MELAEKLTRLRDMKAELAPMLAEVSMLEKEIKTEILDTGEIPDVDGVQVAIRNGYDRISWNSKALKGYAVAHPEINEFCKVAQVGPSVAIKYL